MANGRLIIIPSIILILTHSSLSDIWSRISSTLMAKDTLPSDGEGESVPVNNLQNNLFSSPFLVFSGDSTFAKLVILMELNKLMILMLYYLHLSSSLLCTLALIRDSIPRTSIPSPCHLKASSNLVVPNSQRSLRRRMQKPLKRWLVTRLPKTESRRKIRRLWIHIDVIVFLKQIRSLECR